MNYFYNDIGYRTKKTDVHTSDHISHPEYKRSTQCCKIIEAVSDSSII
jgi:hypothetical protein